MNIGQASKAWLSSQRRADELGLVLGFGGMFKLICLRNFEVGLATVLAIAVIDVLIAGRALIGTHDLSHYPRSIGLRPALAIIVVASVVLLIPLGEPGCVAIATAGIVILMAPRIGSLAR